MQYLSHSIFFFTFNDFMNVPKGNINMYYDLRSIMFSIFITVHVSSVENNGNLKIEM